MKILHINTNKVDARYLFYLLQSIDFPIKKHKRYWISEYSKISIDLPPISEQKRIAKKLDKIFAVIDLKSEMVLSLLLKQKALFTNLRLSVLRKTFQVKNNYYGIFRR